MDRLRKVMKAWRYLSAASHFTITVVAVLASSGYLHASNVFLAILIAWANACNAAHNYAAARDGTT